MDRQGIDVQALSLYVGQYYYWAEASLAERVVRVQNQKLQEICASRPKRPKNSVPRPGRSLRPGSFRRPNSSTNPTPRPAADRMTKS